MLTARNPAALLALMWYHATGGKGLKDMVVLPYKDRLLLFSRYLQQLVMESLGKRLDLDGKRVDQGISVYGNILQQQTQALTTMGPNNPLCTLGQFSNTLHDMMNAAGILNTGRYFNPLPTNFSPPPPPPPPPTSDMIMAQVEAAKVQQQGTESSVKAHQAVLEALLEDDRLRDEARAKALLGAADLRGKYGMDIDFESIGHLLDRNPMTRMMMLQAGGPPAPPATAGPRCRRSRHPTACRATAAPDHRPPAGRVSAGPPSTRITSKTRAPGLPTRSNGSRNPTGQAPTWSKRS